MSTNSRIATIRLPGLRSLAVELRLFVGLAALIVWLFTR